MGRCLSQNRMNRWLNLNCLSPKLILRSSQNLKLDQWFQSQWLQNQRLNQSLKSLMIQS
jgi:hypothetical protein